MKSSSDPLWAFGAEFVAWVSGTRNREDPGEKNWAGHGFTRCNEESAL